MKPATFKTIVVIVVLSLLMLARSLWTASMNQYNNTPAGLQQIKVDQIYMCGEAAKRGVLGPGCEPLPHQPPSNTTIIVPSPFSQTQSSDVQFGANQFRLPNTHFVNEADALVHQWDPTPAEDS